MSGLDANVTAGILTDLVRPRPEITPITDQVKTAFDLLRTAFATGHKLLTCGNGGSAADAGHIVSELMKGVSQRRPLLWDEAAAFALLASAGQRDYLRARLERVLAAIDPGSQQALMPAIGNDTAGERGGRPARHWLWPAGRRALGALDVGPAGERGPGRRDS